MADIFLPIASLQIRRSHKFFAFAVSFFVFVVFFAGCSKKGSFAGGAADNGALREVSFSALEKTGSMSLRYAKQFSVDEYSVSGSDDAYESGEAGGLGDFSGTPVYRLVRTSVGDAFLLMPDGAAMPQNIPHNITPLQLPLKNVYLVATSAMDLINAVGALGDIAFSGTKAKDWSVPEASAAMEAGKIAYAGKYSAPDYELLTAGNCDLAIESTMIYHKPEVKEKLEELGIPVFVEHSSYEAHPLGRLEWIKLYGVLFGKEAVAEQYYENELSRIEPIMQKSASGKSVAFFYVNSNGAVNVRKPDDYIVKMIKLAGGKYALDNLFVEEDNALSTVNMMMEDFYVSCVDADILIYNGTIDTAFSSIDDLFAKSELFHDFTAVKNGHVYFASKDFYQQSTGMADFIEDLYKVLHGESGDFVYLTKL